MPPSHQSIAAEFQARLDHNSEWASKAYKGEKLPLIVSSLFFLAQDLIADHRRLTEYAMGRETIATKTATERAIAAERRNEILEAKLAAIERLVK